jgi:hypothetical protein
MLWWLSTHKKFPGTNVVELEEENLWEHSMVIGHQPSTLVGLWLKTHIVISSISMYKYMWVFLEALGLWLMTHIA